MFRRELRTLKLDLLKGRVSVLPGTQVTLELPYIKKGGVLDLELTQRVTFWWDGKVLTEMPR